MKKETKKVVAKKVTKKTPAKKSTFGAHRAKMYGLAKQEDAGKA